MKRYFMAVACDITHFNTFIDCYLFEYPFKKWKTLFFERMYTKNKNKKDVLWTCKAKLAVKNKAQKMPRFPYKL